METSELSEIANEYGTPAFVFDVDAFCTRMSAVQDIFGPRVTLCYAMKANPFFAPAAASEGYKLEVCSPGELSICEAASIPAKQIVYSGVNKQPHDIAEAIRYGAGVLTAESKLHVRLIEQQAAQAGEQVEVLLRLNAGSQFGMSKCDLREIIRARADYPHLNFVGLHYFVGTQRKKLKHQIRELGMLQSFMNELEQDFGFKTQRLEYGPGLAVPLFVDDDFSDDLLPARELASYLQQIAEVVDLTIEMGRFFASPCGVYLTQAVDIKENEGVNYCILDGGINHLTYVGQIMGLKVPRLANLTNGSRRSKHGVLLKWTLCGSLCTVNDVLVRECELDGLEPGDVLAFYNAGAYAVTEGVHLFLSRAMPRVVLRYDCKNELARDFIETYRLNTVGMD